jgi:hypothetical protein
MEPLHIKYYNIDINVTLTVFIEKASSLYPNFKHHFQSPYHHLHPPIFKHSSHSP